MTTPPTNSTSHPLGQPLGQSIRTPNSQLITITTIKICHHWNVMISYWGVKFNIEKWFGPSVDQCFARESAGFLDRSILVYLIDPDLTCAWSQSCLSSRCLILPVPSLWRVPWHAELSPNISSCASTPNSCSKVLAPISSVPPLSAALSSASPLDRAILAWVRLHWWRQWLPLIKAPPDVDFRVRAHPAQSESTKQWIDAVGSCQG